MASICPDEAENAAPRENRSLRLHRPAHVAECLDISLSTVRRLMRDGELEVVHIGGSVRITETSLKALLKDGRRRAKRAGKK